MYKLQYRYKGEKKWNSSDIEFNSLDNFLDWIDGQQSVEESKKMEYRANPIYLNDRVWYDADRNKSFKRYWNVVGLESV